MKNIEKNITMVDQSGIARFWTCDLVFQFFVLETAITAQAENTLFALEETFGKLAAVVLKTVHS